MRLLRRLNCSGGILGCKGKAKSIPLGGARHNHSFVADLTNKYGNCFAAGAFTALGLDFNNTSKVHQLIDANYKSILNRYNHLFLGIT